nr:YfiR family protein [Bacteroidota bacterium]
MNRYKNIFRIFFLIGFIFSGANLYSQVKGTSENIMGSFIYNFAEFLTWPNLNESDDFKIVVLGNCGILKPLQQISEMRTIDGKKITVKNIQNIDELESCHILYISEKRIDELAIVLKSLENFQTVTISNCEGCLQKGLSINFVIENEKVRFEINKTMLDKNKVKISSQLLKLAVVII